MTRDVSSVNPHCLNDSKPCNPTGDGRCLSCDRYADAGVISEMTDAEGVDKFARAMKRKLARKAREGRSGWNDPLRCSPEYLAQLLADELTADDGKPDPVNIGNYAMMLYHRGAAGRRALREVCQQLTEAIDD